MVAAPDGYIDAESANSWVLTGVSINLMHITDGDLTNSTSNTIHFKLRGYSDSIIAHREVSSPLDALVRELRNR